MDFRKGVFRETDLVETSNSFVSFFFSHMDFLMDFFSKWILGWAETDLVETSNSVALVGRV